MMLQETQRRFVTSLLEARGEDMAPGLAIYHYAYRTRLLDSLKSVFTKLWAWLGDEAFEAAGHAYIDAYPSVSWTLNDFGAEFDLFLAGLYPDDPEVPELAWLERALHKAFSGANAVPLDLQVLGVADWSAAGLKFAPTLAHRQILSRAADIWSALSKEEAAPTNVWLEAPMGLAVWRQGFEPKFRSFDLSEYDALCALQTGEYFAVVCDRIVNSTDQDPTAIAAGWLGLWLRDGLVTGVT